MIAGLIKELSYAYDNWKIHPTVLKFSSLSLASATVHSTLRTLTSGLFLWAYRPFPTTLPV